MPASPHSSPLRSSALAADAPRSKGERTAERILDAAEGLFAERGYAGATLRDVAAAVGIRIPSLYNHFESKEALYAAVLDRGLGPILELLDRAIEAPVASRPDPAQMVSSVMELLARQPNLPRLVLQETLTGGQRLTPALRERLAPIFSKAYATAEAQDEAGRFSKDEIPLVVLALYHAVVGFHTIAPLYRELVGDDLASETSRTNQTRFLTRLSESLFQPEREPEPQPTPTPTRRRTP